MKTQAGRQEHADYVGLLKAIFDFLLQSGADVRAVRRIVSQAFAETISRKEQTRRLGDTGLATAGRALDAWHRNRRYVDNNAQPKAIPLLGPAPSVEALIRSENARCDTAALARQLKSSGLLIRSGRNRFKPATRFAVIAEPNPMIQQYAARASVTLLRTITHNVSGAGRSRRLIERFAEVPDLPASCASEFRKFSQEQGWAMLKTLNDWLESRRVRRVARSDKRTVRAGMHVYAYLGPGKG